MQDHQTDQNQLLARLPWHEYERLTHRMQRVVLPKGEVVCDPGAPIRHVHFPTTGLLSSVVDLHDAETVEATMIGNEGMAGFAASVDECASPYRVVQQVAGEVLLVPTEDFRGALAAGPKLRDVVGRYLLTVLQQDAQNVACSLHHTIEPRMCRWLLETADRIGNEEFRVTQEFLSEMLGVSRQSVNATAGMLQHAGLIAYRRGSLRIVDRAGLEGASCECYRVSKAAYERLMRSPSVCHE